MVVILAFLCYVRRRDRSLGEGGGGEENILYYSVQVVW